MGCRFFHFWYLVKVYLFLVILWENICTGFVLKAELQERPRLDLGIDLAEENTWIFPVQIGCDLSRSALKIVYCTLSVVQFLAKNHRFPMNNVHVLASLALQCAIKVTKCLLISTGNFTCFVWLKRCPELPSALNLSFKSIKCRVVRLDNLISPLFSQELLLEIFLLCKAVCCSVVTV